MTKSLKVMVALGLGLSLGRASAAEAPATGKGPGPNPVPLTRKDMKQALEDSKRSLPRLPLPPLTAEEKARAESPREEPNARARGLGGGLINNGRMRSFYLSDYAEGLKSGLSGLGAVGGASFSRDGGSSRAPGAAGDYAFQTMLFWIVSRGNNCTYCMGHQESKLASAGLTDDQIAALDGDWSGFDPARRAAFAFAKKLTFEPHAMTAADITALRAHYDDAKIAEILLAVAGFNSMNRWTGPLRIPQEERHVYLKPTSEAFAALVTRVAPAEAKGPASGCVLPKEHRRPALEPRPEVEAALEAAKARNPRLKLADESATRALLNGTLGDAPVTNWMRLVALSPESAPTRVAANFAAERKGKLDPKTKAIIAWVCARNDRAWYALGHARERLRALGLSDDQIFALDRPESLESPADCEVARYAAKITVNPALADDGDIERLRKLFDDRTVAEVVFQVTQAAYFDRMTEAAGLRLED